jgi:hypothetical protein
MSANRVAVMPDPHQPASLKGITLFVEDNKQADTSGCISPTVVYIASNHE